MSTGGTLLALPAYSANQVIAVFIGELKSSKARVADEGVRSKVKPVLLNSSMMATALCFVACKECL